MREASAKEQQCAAAVELLEDIDRAAATINRKIDLLREEAREAFLGVVVKEQPDELHLMREALKRLNAGSNGIGTRLGWNV